jgi:metal-responsive CopG/Arc/MetJ family transcriptional regulator
MAKKPTTRKTRVFSISFPEQMASQVDAIAQKEGRTTSEIFREAFRAYSLERMHRILEAARAEAAQRGPNPYTEDDVERLVHEVRQEMHEERMREMQRKTA